MKLRMASAGDPTVFYYSLFHFGRFIDSFIVLCSAWANDDTLMLMVMSLYIYKVSEIEAQSLVISCWGKYALRHEYHCCGVY